MSNIKGVVRCFLRGEETRRSPHTAAECETDRGGRSGSCGHKPGVRRPKRVGLPGHRTHSAGLRSTRRSPDSKPDASRFGDGMDHETSQFVSELAELLPVQFLDVSGTVYS